MKNIDRYYMQQALILANRGKLTVSPNPMVGCIIVKNGAIISEGWHSIAGEPHAEIHALNKVGIHAKDSIVYVTLEPCCHQGRTAPCTDALIKAGVKKVIIATLDPNPKVAGNGVKKLLEAGIEVEVGLLEKQSQQLNKIFFHYQRNQTPFVYAKWAMSLDGKISVNSNDSKKISSEKAFVNTHQLRNICDAILVGRQTLNEDNPRLDVRINVNKCKNPIRFILFSKIDEIDNNWKVLDQNTAKTIFVCSDISDKAKSKLNQLGIEYWTLISNNKQVCLKSLLEKMGNMGITSLLVEGGKKTLESFIDKKLINEFDTYLSPVIISNLNPKENLFFNKISKLGNDLVINSSFKENKNV
ncbi:MULTISPECIES: bifunctional diaminohydroxyphosphoribosylaminopyrimidine deaminase/5-amino-6-(5-phosphoribosylamino)uracil reductase RibD [unclassified Francisella]|uniref:bifunctional diaminohydroxyphosphoribosylaminopyrimidine deaminase/5-amino-6-(5-phosphoribosylamino)uracil reductase RibD n=1 Tax=unclassified Francisella TaxID=2610885 RepID=UPI002E3392D4|nr:MULTISPECIES: bifunctional diaminohydroxyphosphoribosylaminopyrimidine deaminase/5-amino-6-(5-phosphoribosylamino)uracil reductase RibD [unclassified Francisella]MED7819537.1 bifunctional diaminohydroxyphosphoribosylaminopyrimidine deaminase/5-amino-6-(5-phosphoribosylamino)uracil reductase RibD [Francisella sp. 19S2-4]MED7830349.1 bifunctional diaminohydroxyphosphoribosylaminopyrimidine deaminase/5-amino-6-(5-phosphoribosylamino)uracil reductase RibD [Francisella sp. 19S2-10]